MPETVIFNWECRPLHMKMGSPKVCERYREKFNTCGDCPGPVEIHDVREIVLSEAPPVNFSLMGKRKNTQTRPKEESAMAKKICNSPDCEKVLSLGNKTGLCFQHKHIGTNWEKVSTCQVEGCQEGITARNKSGYCTKHHYIDSRKKSQMAGRPGITNAPKPSSARPEIALSPGPRNDRVLVTLDFSEYPELLENLKARAKTDFRSPDQQVMYDISLSYLNS